MAPPVEEGPTKVVKVSTTVVKRQPTKVEETKSTTPPSQDEDLHLSVLEESFRNAHSGSEGRSVLLSLVWFFSIQSLVFFFQLLFVILTSLLLCAVLGHRSDNVVGRSEEAVYLSGLKTLWRGFIHMHAVAKLVTKAFPVSGIMDNLNEVRRTKTNPLTSTCQHRFHPGFVSPTGPSRQHSGRGKDQSTDCVGLLGEDSSNWHKSRF